MELITIHPFVKRALAKIKNTRNKHFDAKRRTEFEKLNTPARVSEYQQTHELLKRALKPLAKMMLSVGIKNIECCHLTGQLSVYFNDKGSYPELFNMQLWPRRNANK